jgi:hypothetical protein
MVLLFGLATLGFLAGCDDDNDSPLNSHISTPPQIPQGVYSVTGDGAVYIHWLPIDDINNDFAFYAVYRSDTHPDTGYWEIGTTDDIYFIDDNVINGHTYYYAVSSVDVDGFESALSYEYVPDTPRPEGFGQTIYDYISDPSRAGWDLDNYHLVDWQSPGCDFYLEWLDGDGVFYFNVGNTLTDIQDMGYTGHFDEIDYSPPADSGWSDNGWCEVILHHTYIIWTDNNHFAKIRVTSIGSQSITFDWGYQIDPGNRELKPRVNNNFGVLTEAQNRANITGQGI